MRMLLLSVMALIVSFALLLAGNSLQFVVLGLRADLEGFSLPTIGWISAAYFAGFGLGALLAPRVVWIAGHIRTFAAFGSIVSGIALAHALIVDPYAWALMRFVTGFCFAGLYIVVESWLNARADNRYRGRLLSLYGSAAFVGYIVGPIISGLAPASGFDLFVIASIMFSFALVPITLTRASAPVVEEPTKANSFGLIWLFRETPLGVIGIGVISAGQGAFLGLGSTFGARMGLDAESIAGFMSVAMFCGLLFQFPIGWLSDRFDRRAVILSVALFGALGSGLVWFLLEPGDVAWPLLLLTAAVIGTSIFPLYAVMLAYTNDRLPKTSLVGVAAALSLTYSFGSVIGTPLASFFMEAAGPSGFALFLSLILWGLAGFTIFRMIWRKAPVTQDDWSLATVAASPGTIPLDPAAAGDQDRAAPVQDN
ncbi:MFS transporter [Limibacillus sp. MBR-115]|uniref:MFS transporter n=1 Tax=Limibacillus sp. MBR-115 TaxID=3156465 RepID=UPI0033964896